MPADGSMPDFSAMMEAASKGGTGMPDFSKLAGGMPGLGGAPKKNKPSGFGAFSGLFRRHR